MKRFEELLAAYQHECIGYGVAGGVTGGGGIETAPLVAARSALVEYVRERMKPEQEPSMCGNCGRVNCAETRGKEDGACSYWVPR